MSLVSLICTCFFVYLFGQYYYGNHWKMRVKTAGQHESGRKDDALGAIGKPREANPPPNLWMKHTWCAHLQTPAACHCSSRCFVCGWAAQVEMVTQNEWFLLFGHGQRQQSALSKAFSFLFTFGLHPGNSKHATSLTRKLQENVGHW